MGNIGVGALKPNKVKQRKTQESNIGIIPAGTKSLKMMTAKVPIDNSK